MTHTVIITDTHFGIKNNSQKWLSKQLEGLNEVLEYIHEYKYSHQDDEVLLVHCGDVFDSRSSINTMVLKEARNMLYELADSVKEFIIIGGNHDYYSPNEEYIEVNTLDLLLQHPNITLITKGYDIRGINDFMYMFVPYYFFDGDKFNLPDLLKQYDPKVVFTHADLYNTFFDGKIVISGHIHTPVSYGNSHNICSTFATTFADANSERGFYTLDCEQFCYDLKLHPLKNIIRFHTLFDNTDGFFDSRQVNTYDYMRIYVTTEHRQDPRYMKVVEKYQEMCDNVEVIIYNADSNINESFSDVIDMDSIISSMIPDYLQEKFENIKCTTLKN